MENAQSETVRESFERLFERAGLPQAIRSDNGAPFASVHGLFGLSRLSAWWVALGIDLEGGRPGHPQDNAAHERMHGDISREIEALGSVGSGGTRHVAPDLQLRTATRVAGDALPGRS